MNSDNLKSIANEIEQGFMQKGGHEACLYLLTKLVAEVRKKEHEECAKTIDERACQHELKMQETVRTPDWNTWVDKATEARECSNALRGFDEDGKKRQIPDN